MDLEHSFPPSHSFLEIEQNKVPEKPHDRPDISRTHRCTYQLLARGKGPKGEEGPSVPHTRGPSHTPNRLLFLFGKCLSEQMSIKNSSP